MSKIIVMSCLMLTMAMLSLPAQSIATGIVYEDRNADGLRNAAEPGIAGVRVSNGREVVQTGKDGRYRLPVDEEAIIFISKPRDYATPANGYMLPQFYYIHQPKGSPAALRFPGIAPTGPLPAGIDFPLRKHKEPASFEAILFADTQPMTGAEVDYIRDDIISELIGTSARFGMTLGDIMYDDLALFPRYLSVVAQLGIPWYNVPGNHEMNMPVSSDRYALETFKHYFGPPYYAFEYGNAVFIVLDNIEYAGTKSDDPMDVRNEGGYIARITEPQLEWLRNELAFIPEDKLVFLAMHAPLGSYIGDYTSITTANRRELFGILSGRKHLYAVAGHTHTTEHLYYGEEDGFSGPGRFHHHILSTVSGSWWSGPRDERGLPVTVQRDGTPNGYHLLEIDGTELTVRYKAAGKAADYQMEIMFDVAYHYYEKEALRDYRPGEHLDGRMSVDELPAARIIVNLFDGGPNSGVRYRLAGGTYLPMERRAMPDPLAGELFFRNEALYKPWAKPIPSSHIWIADLPDNLTPGTYTVTVEASDEFGRTHHAHKIMEITGSSSVSRQELRYPQQK